MNCVPQRGLSLLASLPTSLSPSQDPPVCPRRAQGPQASSHPTWGRSCPAHSCNLKGVGPWLGGHQLALAAVNVRGSSPGVVPLCSTLHGVDLPLSSGSPTNTSRLTGRGCPDPLAGCRSFSLSPPFWQHRAPAAGSVFSPCYPPFEVTPKLAFPSAYARWLSGGPSVAPNNGASVVLVCFPPAP